MQININDVIARMRSGEDGDSFVLEFIAASGKKKGQRVKKVCRYGAPAQAAHTPARQRNGQPERRDHAERGTLPLTDLSTTPRRYITPLISHMVFYNHMKITH